MGKVLQRAGGGKVTVEGLAAGNIKKGATVTVKQGNKVVQSADGTYTGNTPGGTCRVIRANASGQGNWKYNSGSISVPQGKFTVLAESTLCAYEKGGSTSGANISLSVSFNGAGVGNGSQIEGPGTLSCTVGAYGAYKDYVDSVGFFGFA